MRKKLEADLMALARSILDLKSGTDIGLLKTNAQQIYEQLCILEYLKLKEETPNESEQESDTPLIKKESLFSIEDEIDIPADIENIFIKKETQEITEIETESQILKTTGTLKDKIEAAKEAEQQDLNTDSKTAEEPIENATINTQSKPKTSLNEKLTQKVITVDLNDRIALVKHLFEGNQDDFNRVLSQLNTFETEIEAKDFILNQVKPDYSWQEKEAYEERLLILIGRKFN